MHISCLPLFWWEGDERVEKGINWCQQQILSIIFIVTRLEFHLKMGRGIKRNLSQWLQLSKWTHDVFRFTDFISFGWLLSFGIFPHFKWKIQPFLQFEYKIPKCCVRLLQIQWTGSLLFDICLPTHGKWHVLCTNSCHHSCNKGETNQDFSNSNLLLRLQKLSKWKNTQRILVAFIKHNVGSPNILKCNIQHLSKWHRILFCLGHFKVLSCQKVVDSAALVMCIPFLSAFRKNFSYGLKKYRVGSCYWP